MLNRFLLDRSHGWPEAVGARHMNRHDIEEKLPTMTQPQLVETVKTCLDMIERLETDLAVGTLKLDEMTALLRKLSDARVGS